MTDTTDIEARSLRPSLAPKLDAICDRFEAALKGGHRPALEVYLEEVDGADRRCCCAS